jgi:DNA replication and repair protein RecF
MAIDRLSISDFRNHADALLVTDAALVLLTGDNGAGKTNILEAVSLLAPGRGLRGAALSAMARQDGPGGFGIAAQVDGRTIGTGMIAQAPERRQVRINGRAAAATSLAEHLSVLWLTPAMDRLFADSPGARRRFLDRLVLAVEPGHGVASNRYEAAMRARNALLGGERGPTDPAWLAALEGQMAEHGAAIDAARRALVAALGDALAQAPEGPFARPIVVLDGEPASVDALRSALRDGRSRDAAAGRALAGPHRDDLLVRHAAKGQAAALCSTGEQKALLLSIVLAHGALVAARSDRPLLLLLDEVAAHLDPARRLALFDRLRGLGGQVWMTGTEAALFAGLDDAAHFAVGAGQVRRLG